MALSAGTRLRVALPARLGPVEAFHTPQRALSSQQQGRAGEMTRKQSPIPTAHLEPQHALAAPPNPGAAIEFPIAYRFFSSLLGRVA
jgi:hypothetical protein